MTMRKRKPGVNHLNLQRRLAGQPILITGGISVSVYRMRGRKVWLRVEAPDSIDVWREELAPPEFLEQHDAARLPRGAA